MGASPGRSRTSDTTGGVGRRWRPARSRCCAPAPAVTHSEVAAAPQTRFVQVWLTPPTPGGEPSYDVLPVDAVPGAGFVEAASPVPGATFWVARLGDGETVTTPAAPHVHVFVARGALLRSSLAEPLHDGDAFLFTDEPAHDAHRRRGDRAALLDVRPSIRLRSAGTSTRPAQTNRRRA